MKRAAKYNTELSLIIELQTNEKVRISSKLINKTICHTTLYISAMVTRLKNMKRVIIFRYYFIIHLFIQQNFLDKQRKWVPIFYLFIRFINTVLPYVYKSQIL